MYWCPTQPSRPSRRSARNLRKLADMAHPEGPGEIVEMPMFPLGTALFPTQPLPLHVFEPRYRQMTVDLLEGDGRFGVVWIERGSEVGGHDQRSNYGTVAQVMQCQPLPDGRFRLFAVGVERLRVVEWLPDDPYPRARVELVADTDQSARADELAVRYGEAKQVLRRALALATELGISQVPLTAEFTDDPPLGSYQLSALAPLSPPDRHRLLGAPGPLERLDALIDQLTTSIVLFETELALAGSDPDDRPD
jgi:Lon protease-like protein